MADNIAVTPGSGATLGADLVSGVYYVLEKACFGADGAIVRVQATAGAGLPIEGVSGGQAVPVSASALPLPSGAATAAKQPALGTAGTPSADVLSIQGHASMTAVIVDPSGVTSPVSVVSLPLPTGASTAAKQPALGTAGTPSADVISVQGHASMTALVVDPSGVTSPISAASLPLPSGAATSAKQAALGTAGSASADVLSIQGIASMTPLKAVSAGTLNNNAASWTTATSQNAAVTLISADPSYKLLMVAIQQGGLGTLSGGAVTFEVFNDIAGGWVPISGTNTQTSAYQGSVLTLSNGTYSTIQFNLGGWQYFRVRLSSVITGSSSPSVNVAFTAVSMVSDPNTNIITIGGGQAQTLAVGSNVALGTAIYDSTGTQLTATSHALDVNIKSGSIPSGTNTIGGVNPVSAATGGWAPHSYITANSTNGTSGVISGACRLHAIEIGNNNSTGGWLKIYDATSVTPGSGTPVLRYLIPANASGVAGYYFPDAALATGLSFSVTLNAANADTNAVAAGITINLLASS